MKEGFSVGKMKTLDEVIAELTDCIEYDMDCSECKSFASCTGRPWREFDMDALHYLREYRQQRRTVAKLSKLFYEMFEWIDEDNPTFDGHQIEEALIKAYNRWDDEEQS